MRAEDQKIFFIDNIMNYEISIINVGLSPGPLIPGLPESLFATNPEKNRNPLQKKQWVKSFDAMDYRDTDYTGRNELVVQCMKMATGHCDVTRRYRKPFPAGPHCFKALIYATAGFSLRGSEVI